MAVVPRMTVDVGMPPTISYLVIEDGAISDCGVEMLCLVSEVDPGREDEMPERPEEARLDTNVANMVPLEGEDETL